MSSHFYDIVDASNRPVGWWPAEHPSDEHAVAGLEAVPLEDGQWARVFRSDANPLVPLASIRAGRIEVGS